MSRKLAAVLTLMFFLGGCAPSTTKAAPVAVSFSCDAAITYRDMATEGHLTRAAAGTLMLQFSKPETLAGIVLSCDGETLRIERGTLSVPLEKEDVPSSALISSLLTAFDTLIQSTGEAAACNEGAKLVCETPDGAFELVFNPENGHLHSLSMPSIGLSAAFSAFEKTAA